MSRGHHAQRIEKVITPLAVKPGVLSIVLSRSLHLQARTVHEDGQLSLDAGDSDDITSRVRGIHDLAAVRNDTLVGSAVVDRGVLANEGAAVERGAERGHVIGLRFAHRDQDDLVGERFEVRFHDVDLRAVRQLERVIGTFGDFDLVVQRVPILADTEQHFGDGTGSQGLVARALAGLEVLGVHRLVVPIGDQRGETRCHVGMQVGEAFGFAHHSGLAHVQGADPHVRQGQSAGGIILGHRAVEVDVRIAQLILQARVHSNESVLDDADAASGVAEADGVGDHGGNVFTDFLAHEAVVDDEVLAHRDEEFLLFPVHTNGGSRFPHVLFGEEQVRGPANDREGQLAEGGGDTGRNAANEGGVQGGVDRTGAIHEGCLDAQVGIEGDFSECIHTGEASEDHRSLAIGHGRAGGEIGLEAKVRGAIAGVLHVGLRGETRVRVVLGVQLEQFGGQSAGDILDNLNVYGAHGAAVGDQVGPVESIEAHGAVLQGHVKQVDLDASGHNAIGHQVCRRAIVVDLQRNDLLRLGVHEGGVTVQGDQRLALGVVACRRQRVHGFGQIVDLGVRDLRQDDGVFHGTAGQHAVHQGLMRTQHGDGHGQTAVGGDAIGIFAEGLERLAAVATNFGNGGRRIELAHLDRLGIHTTAVVECRNVLDAAHENARDFKRTAGVGIGRHFAPANEFVESIDVQAGVADGVVGDELGDRVQGFHAGRRSGGHQLLFGQEFVGLVEDQRRSGQILRVGRVRGGGQEVRFEFFELTHLK